MAQGSPISYTRLREISRGGMGAVELVIRRQGRFRRLFARKRLYPPYRDDPGFRAMFLDEARIAGLASHPNVVGVLEAGEDEDGPYLITEYVEGAPLARLIARLGEKGERVPLQVAARLGAEVARGLHAAHEATGEDGALLGVVHRDVSPHNILVGYDGAARVADFGIAKALGNLTRTHAGVLKGNLGYLSPEQLRFEEPDRRSDLFSLGVVLYELLTGARLYANEEGTDGARRILDDPPPDLADARPDAPPRLVELLFELLAKRREKRPETARAVAQRLETVCGGLVAEEGLVDPAEFVQATFAEAIAEERALRRRALERVTDPGLPEEAPARVEPPGAPPAASGRRRVLAVAAIASGVAALGAVTAAIAVSIARPGPAAPPAPTPGSAPSQLAPRTPDVPSPGSSRTVWAAGWHSCGMDDGVLYCWGKGNDGQVGAATTLDVPIRQRVRSLPPIVAAAPGFFHTCACTRAGEVHCWGRNAEGQLGAGGPASALEAVAVEGLSRCVAIAAGARHSCAVDRGGAVHCWGSNTRGQLADPAADSAPRPRRVAGLADIVEIEADGDFTCARRKDGAVLCWGDNTHGQLGDGTTEARHAPTPVAGLEAIGLGLGHQFACAIRRARTVACWGHNAFGQTGAPRDAEPHRPFDVPGLEGVVQLAGGEGHACALGAAGWMRCWGRNNFGQVGDGTRADRTAPTPVVTIPSQWLSIAVGAVHTCARHHNGVACWGRNGTAQLGDGLSEDRARPVSVAGFRDAF